MVGVVEGVRRRLVDRQRAGVGGARRASARRGSAWSRTTRPSLMGPVLLVVGCSAWAGSARAGRPGVSGVGVPGPDRSCDRGPDRRSHRGTGDLRRIAEGRAGARRSAPRRDRHSTTAEHVRPRLVWGLALRKTRACRRLSRHGPVFTRSTPPRSEGCRPASRGLTLALMTCEDPSRRRSHRPAHPAASHSPRQVLDRGCGRRRDRGPGPASPNRGRDSARPGGDPRPSGTAVSGGTAGSARHGHDGRRGRRGRSCVRPPGPPEAAAGAVATGRPAPARGHDQTGPALLARQSRHGLTVGLRR